MIAPGSVKICSLREPDHARWVVEAGADFFGLIFAPSKRQVMPETAASIVIQARSEAGDSAPRAVGVFVNADVVAINKVVERVGLDLVQLHGEVTPDDVGEIAAPVIRAVRVEPGATFDAVAAQFDLQERTAVAPVAYLIDGFHPQHAGGHGVLADWEMARQLAERFPIILAGGLTRENVAEAIAQVRPLGVDVSSGVETDGIKNRAKVIDFVSNARRAFKGGD